MSPHFNKVRYKAYQIDEGPDFDDGNGPPPPPVTGATLECWVLFPSATIGSPSDWDPTYMWVGNATDASDAIAGQIQGIFPVWDTFWRWAPLFGTAGPPDEILPDTWYHTVLVVNITDSVGAIYDYTFSVDGVEIMNETDVAGSVAGFINQIGVGADGTGANVDGYLYIDDVFYDSGDGLTFADDFEGHGLSFWFDQTGDVSVDTGTFHGGAASLKANQEPAAFVVLNV